MERVNRIIMFHCHKNYFVCFIHVCFAVSTLLFIQKLTETANMMTCMPFSNTLRSENKQARVNPVGITAMQLFMERQYTISYALS